MTKRSYLTITLFCVMLLATLGTSAQTGRATVHFQGIELDSLTIINTRTNRLQSTLEGYRIQIYSGSGSSAKQEAMAAQTKFLQLFPDEAINTTYSAPFWRVRVGNYRFRSEALELLNKVKRNFQGSYIVRDNAVKKRVFND